MKDFEGVNAATKWFCWKEIVKNFEGVLCCFIMDFAGPIFTLQSVVY